MRTYEYAVEIYGKDNWNFLRQIDVFSDKDVAIEIGKRIETADDEEVHITTIEREDNEEQVDCSSERLNDLIKELDMKNRRYAVVTEWFSPIIKNEEIVGSEPSFCEDINIYTSKQEAFDEAVSLAEMECDYFNNDCEPDRSFGIPRGENKFLEQKQVVMNCYSDEDTYPVSIWHIVPVNEEGIDYKMLWNKAFEWIAENAFPEDYDNFVDRLNLTPEEKRELGIEEEM